MAHLERLDHEARLNEVSRMINIPAMIESDPGEVEREGGYIISTFVRRLSSLGSMGLSKEVGSEERDWWPGSSKAA